jgi:hypothetical protein
MRINKKLVPLIVIGALLIANISGLKVSALGTLTHASVLEMGGTGNVNPMIVSAGQSLAIDFTTATATTGTTTITLTFTGWTGSTAGIVNTTQTAPTTGGCTTLFPGTPTAVPGTLTAAGASTTITISGVTAMAATTNYCTTLPSVTAVTNPAAAGPYSVVVSTASDTQTTSIDVLSSGANAYTITGTITPSFTMSLSSNTDTFASNLTSTGVVVSTGITTTINTNAKSGWYLWAEDANAGLHSTQAGYTIPTVATGSNYNFSTNHGTEGYGMGVVTSGTDTGITNTTNYAYGGGTTGSGLSTSSYNEIATATGPASGSTGSSTDSIVTHELANISASTAPATDYTDTITLIGAGSF